MQEHIDEWVSSVGIIFFIKIIIFFLHLLETYAHTSIIVLQVYLRCCCSMLYMKLFNAIFKHLQY